MDRINRDKLYMEIARLVSHRGTCPRAQVGAVLVRDWRIISSGYNGALAGQPHCTDVGCGGGVDGVNEWENATGDQVFPVFPNGCTRAIHAEANALIYAARSGVSTDAATMYCTHAMCASCAALVVAAGIVKVVYCQPYRSNEGLELLSNMKVEVIKHE